ncbi:MAG: hypothetical protein R2752_12730 [Vicinamibacterales bacterium]
MRRDDTRSGSSRHVILRGRHVALAAAVLGLVTAARSTPEARQGQGAAPTLVPVAASSIAKFPDTYVGETVSMMAAVDRILSPTAFSVDQDKAHPAAAGTDVLVIVPTLQSPPPVDTYITVIGKVLRLDAVEIAKEAGGKNLNLSADIIAQYQGRPVLLATSVIDPKMDDLAKVPPPPMSPEEVAFSEVMKRVNAASGALRTALGESAADQVTPQTTALAAAFTDAEAFFKARGIAEAAGWAAEARAQAEAVQKAATSGSWETANTAATALTQYCQRCHAGYRVRMEDGTYRVKSDR